MKVPGLPMPPGEVVEAEAGLERPLPAQVLLVLASVPEREALAGPVAP